MSVIFFRLIVPPPCLCASHCGCSLGDDLPGAEREASQQQHAVGRPEVEPASADGQGETDQLELDPTDTDFTLDDERTPS
jgi:hypothetical protein